MVNNVSWISLYFLMKHYFHINCRFSCEEVNDILNKLYWAFRKHSSNHYGGSRRTGKPIVPTSMPKISTHECASIEWEKWAFVPNLQIMQQNVTVLKLYNKMLLFFILNFNKIEFYVKLDILKIEFYPQKNFSSKICIEFDITNIEFHL